MGDHSHLGITRAEVVDGGLRLARPMLAPTVLLIGCTDNTTPNLEDPFRIERGSEIADFDLAAGTPSELTKAIQEAQGAGAENIEVFVLSDGSGTRWSSLTNLNRYNALTRAYELLLNHEVDFVVPVGACVDASGLAANTSFSYQLANHCHRGTKEFTARFGFLGATAPTAAVQTTGTPSLSDLNTWVEALKAYDTSALLGAAFPEYDGTTDAGGDGVPDNYALWSTSDETQPIGVPPADDAQVEKDNNHNPIDMGAYMCVYAGWERFRHNCAQQLYPTKGYYQNNGAAAFAGLCAATPPHEAPRNIPLPGAEVIRNLSSRQADDLATCRFIVSCRKLGQYMVYDAMTSAWNISQYYKSDFTRITTVRILHAAIDQMRAAANSFIRLENDTTNREALKTAIDAGFEMLKGNGLKKWDFDLVYTPAMRTLGELLVDIKLEITEEIQAITGRFGLTV